MEFGQHLAAIADSEAETARVLEEGAEGIPGAGIVPDGAGPAAAGAQYVAVGEAAAGRQALEGVQPLATLHEVAHVHIHRLEAGPVEGRGHLQVAVHPLLPQDGHPGAMPAHRRRPVRVEAEPGMQAGIGVIGQRLELLGGAVGVVAQRLHPVAGLLPEGLQLGPGAVQQGPTGPGHHQPGVVPKATQPVAAAAQARCPEALAHRLDIGPAHLHHGPGFLGEQRPQGRSQRHGQIHVQTQAGGEHHLRQGHDQSPVGAVVVGQQQAIPLERLNGVEQGRQVLGPVQVRRRIPQLGVDLGQSRASQAGRAVPQVDEDQLRLAGVAAQLRGQRAARIRHRRERGDDQRHRRRDLVPAAGAVPGGVHGQGVLAYRNGHPEPRAELRRHRPHRVVEPGVLPRLAGRGHPVGGQIHPAQFAHVGGRQVGEGLGHRQPPGGGGIQQRHGGALPHGHGLAAVALVVRQGHRHVRHRHLPGPHHLVAGHQAAHRAVADGDQELLAGHRRQAQHPLQGSFRADAAKIQGGCGRRLALHIPAHAGRLAQQQVHGDVDRGVAEMPVGELQAGLRVGLPHHRHGAALAGADAPEALQALGVQAQHVAFLCLVAPQLQRRHAGLGTGHLPQLDGAAPAAVVEQFRQGVGQAAGADVVDAQHRAVVPQAPAGVDHLLAAAFHLRVAALH